MSANSARRRRTADQQYEEAGQRRALVRLLLEVRGRLAAICAQHEAHGLDDTAAVFLQVLRVEAAIRAAAPRLYELKKAEWAGLDAELVHAADQHHPACGLCSLVRQHPYQWVPQPRSQR